MRPAAPAGRAPAVLSGANEVAVEAFLAGRIPWTAIAEVAADALAAGTGNVQEVADVLEADRVARERATASVNRLSEARDEHVHERAHFRERAKSSEHAE